MGNLLIKIKKYKAFIIAFFVLAILCYILIVNGTPKQYAYKNTNYSLCEKITEFGDKGLKRDNKDLVIANTNGQFSTYQKSQIKKVVLRFEQLPLEKAFNIRYSKGNLDDVSQFSNWYAIAAKNKTITINIPENGIHSITFDFISNTTISSIKIGSYSNKIYVKDKAKLNILLSLIISIVVSIILIMVSIFAYPRLKKTLYFAKNNCKKILKSLLIAFAMLFSMLVIERIAGLPTLSIRNFLKYCNLPLVYFDFAISISASIFLTFFASIKKRMEIIFLLIAIPAGMTISLCQMNTVHLVWDAPSHMNEVVKLSNAPYYSYSTFYSDYGTYPAGGKISLSALNHDIIKSNADYFEAKLQRNDNNYNIFSFYKAVGYFPMALGMMFSRGFKLSLTMSLFVCKLFNLFSYAGFMYFAIKNARHFKIVFFVISLLPTSIILSSEFSYDPWLTSLFAVAFSIFVNAFFEERIISRKEIVSMSALMFLAVGSKPVYCPMLLLSALIPSNRFKDYVQRKKSIALSLILIVIATFSFVLPIVSATSNGNSLGDSRAPGTNIDGVKQILYIVCHPIDYICIFFDFLFYKYLNYTSLVYLCGFGFGGYFKSSSYLMMNAIPLCSCLFLTNSSLDENKNYDLKRSVLGIIICILVIMSFTSSMYIAFTAVGSKDIVGVQIRYLIPVLIPLLVFSSTFTRKIKIKHIDLTMLYSLILAFVLYSDIYTGLIRLYLF